MGYDTNLAHGKKKRKPYKVYQFNPPSSTLKKLFNSPDFNSLLDKTRSRLPPISDDVMDDVQDAQIWKDFADSNFFSSKYNLALMLYVDWFRPFKRSQYHVGVLILTVLNLPREERFKKRWSIVTGTIIVTELDGCYNFYLDL